MKNNSVKQKDINEFLSFCKRKKLNTVVMVDSKFYIDREEDYVDHFYNAITKFPFYAIDKSDDIPLFDGHEIFSLFFIQNPSNMYNHSIEEEEVLKVYTFAEFEKTFCEKQMEFSF